nr:hypothetical protein [uncultured Sphingomonas sp.]
MGNYPNITHALRTIFNAEDGLSEDVSKRLYQRSAQLGQNTEDLKSELRSAFSDSNSISWKIMLYNSDYEVYDAEDEEDARAYAFKILWQPIFDN